jgi:hypothetical protein
MEEGNKHGREERRSRRESEHRKMNVRMIDGFMIGASSVERHFSVAVVM